MRDDYEAGGEIPTLSGLEQKIRSLDQPPVPDNLLARCLATVDTDEPKRFLPRVLSWTWKALTAAAIAALLFIGVLGVLLRPQDATAANILQSIRSTWTEVPACHRVVVIKGPELTRTEETWFVRGKGGRKEVRSSDQLIGVVGNNGRWEFRWDVPGRLVAAWSTPLIGKRSEFESAGLVHENEALLRWAEQHRADIHQETELLDGRKVRKVVLRWPGPGGVGSHAQVDTVWFDPDTLRPLRQSSESWDGSLIESKLDYPSPGDVPEDILSFSPPRDVTLEINDPDLGRQVYSEGQEKNTSQNPEPQVLKGAKP